MSWAKFDDQYPDHPKIVRVGPLGMALHTAATCYCARYLTDGFVPAAMIPRLINLDGLYTISNGVTNAVTHAELTKELTEAGLFNEAPGGYTVHDYLEYNPPAEQVKQERERTKARQAAWKERHSKKTDDNAVSNGVSNPVDNSGPSPSPSPIKEKKGADAPSLEEPAASPEELVPAGIVENNEVDRFVPSEESVSPSEPDRPSRDIKFNDPAWDVFHGRIPTTPINTQPDMEWIPPDLKDLAEAFLEASNLPGPKDKSMRGYWIASLRTMRLDDRLTQDDVRRAVKKMRSTGGIIKSPESVRSVAVDIRAACGPVFFAEEY